MRKSDLKEDSQRIQYLAEASRFISSLTNAVQREVYGTRAAEAAGISYDAFKIEVDKAYRSRTAREKKKQEKIDLSPARNLQPHSRNFRYDNLKSAMAEETVIAMAVKEPALLDQVGVLSQSHFSSEVLGRAFGQLLQRHIEGAEVSLGILTDFTAEEMAHLAGILQRHDSPINEQAFQDCIRTILSEYQAGEVRSDADILALRDAMKAKKGIRG